MLPQIHYPPPYVSAPTFAKLKFSAHPINVFVFFVFFVFTSSSPVMKKIFLETFGCQMNVLDSELVENQLRILGYDFTPLLDEADVVLYNTCSVRDKSEQKVWSRLGTLKDRKAAEPSLVIGVIGCMAERDGAKLMKRMP